MSIIIPANSLSGGFSVDNSCVFNGSDEYLTRTPSSASNKQVYTLSYWIRKDVDGDQYLAMQGAAAGGDTTYLYFSSGAELVFADYAGGAADDIFVRPSRTYTNAAVWFHLVIAVDTTQGTSSNRVKIYVNGVQETSFATATYPVLNYNTEFNDTDLFTIGRSAAGEKYYNGFMSEVCMIDGSQLAPTSFGEFNDDSVWVPIDVSGLTFGTNGFYLDFSDSSALGADASGNSNNFAVNNIASGNQSTVTPTNNS